MAGIHFKIMHPELDVDVAADRVVSMILRYNYGIDVEAPEARSERSFPMNLRGRVLGLIGLG